VSESLFVHLSEKRFLKVVNAGSFEVKVGHDVIEVLASHKEALKDFASLLDNPEAVIVDRKPPE